MREDLAGNGRGRQADAIQINRHRASVSDILRANMALRRIHSCHKLPKSFQNKADKVIEEIRAGDKILAIILRASYSEPGIHFFTPDDYSQQLGYMRHPRGKIIEPHVHNEVPRAITLTQEVLFIRKGKVRVDFYNDQHAYLESRILENGDVILLSAGGHGFEALEDLEMIEVKQGPYVGGLDKTRFAAFKPGKISLGTEA